MGDVIRLLLSELMVSCWLSDAQRRKDIEAAILRGKPEYKHHLMRPLLNLINSSNIQQQPNIFQPLLAFAHTAFNHYSSHHNIIAWPLLIPLLKHMPSHISNSILQQINFKKYVKNKQMKQIMGCVLLFNYIFKLWKIQPNIPKYIKDLINEHQNQFLKNLYNAIQEFQCHDIYEIGLMQLEKHAEHLAPYLKNINMTIN